ncbi:MAG: hypothetical protein ABSC41_05215 [Acidimicrobiales bacterium]
MRALLVAGGAYLVLALLLWWNVWTGHPTSTTTCGCGDTSLFTWFIEWPAYALSHGLSPFYTTAVGFPGGVNLPANTSELAIGVTLAPVTWLFGPVATLNVALTLAPALSATAMFVLLQRWVSWAPASFFGGLFYGFSPFVLVSLADAHLMLGMAFVPPLVVACLDELIVRRRRPPAVTGLLLGLLVAVQFFIGTEVLLIMAMAAGIGIVMVVVYAALSRPAVVGQAARHVGVGLGAAAVTAGALLAYPTWFALAGPAHLSGPVWPPHDAGYGGNAVRDFVLSAPALSTGFFGSAMSRVVGGSQGPILSSQYVGIGAVAVVVVGTVVWRRDRRLWLFDAVAVVSAVLSLGARHRYFLPWQPFVHLPLFENITPGRFVLITYLAVAVSSAVIIDHCHTAVAGRRHRARHARAEESQAVWRRRVAAAVATIVAAVVLVPSGVYLSAGLPFTTQPVLVPTWFKTVAPHLHGRQVLLILPAPFAVTQTAMTWQAVDEMAFSMVGQGGPAGVLARAGAERAGQSAITDATFFFSPTQAITGPDAVATRQALHGWGVTMVVVPDQPRLPAYERIRSVTAAAALMTAATGTLPVQQADAWVWTGVDRARRWQPPSTDDLSRCLTGLGYDGTSAIEAAASCVLHAGTERP